MEIFDNSLDFKSKLAPIVALGNFDGVHRAHQKMFEMTKKLGITLKALPAAYTFEPHPVKFLAKESAPLLINTLSQKLEIIAATEMQAVIVEPFDKNLANMSPESWFKIILVDRLGAKGVVAGYDFTFGHKRSGTVETLHELSQKYGMEYQILPAQLDDETLISSTQIRNLLQQGKIKAANHLMGRSYFIDGTVVSGAGRGKSIGIPTANLETQNELLPKRGVYATQVDFNLKTYPAVTNIGINPTFAGTELKIETHLINFNQDLLGKTIRIFFMERLRDEKIFDSPEQLMKQIKQDIKRAKEGSLLP